MGDTKIPISRIVNILKFFAAATIFYFHFFLQLDPSIHHPQWFYYGDTLISLLTDISNHPLHFLPLIIRYFGYLGNIVLFSISGWGLMHSRLRKSNRDFSWRTYLRKRASRVLPMYYIAIAFFVAFSLVIGRSTEMTIASMIANVFLLQGVNEATTFWLDAPMWFIPSLLIFYVMFPFMVSSFLKKPHKVLVYSILLAIGSQLIILCSPLNAYNKYYLMGIFPLVNLPAFCFGMWLAVMLYKKNVVFLKLNQNAIALIGVCLIGIGLFAVDTPLVYLQHPLPLAIGCVLAAFPILDSLASMQKFGSILAKLGAWSYALFLFHLPLVYWFVDAYRDKDFMRYPVVVATILLIFFWSVLMPFEMALQRFVSCAFKRS